MIDANLLYSFNLFYLTWGFQVYDMIAVVKVLYVSLWTDAPSVTTYFSQEHKRLETFRSENLAEFWAKICPKFQVRLILTDITLIQEIPNRTIEQTPPLTPKKNQKATPNCTMTGFA